MIHAPLLLLLCVLQDKSPKADTYPLINIQMKGYDFPVLQEFQSWVHKAMENMGLKVSAAWVMVPLLDGFTILWKVSLQMFNIVYQYY